MAEVLFLLSKIKANAVLRYKRLYTSVFIFKKLLVGASALLTLLVVPFAVQAMSGPSGQVEGNGQAQDEPAAAQIGQVNGQQEEKTQNKTKVDVQSNMSSSSSGDGEVDVTINGQHIPVPDDGHVQKTVTGNSNQTSVDIQVHNQSTSSNMHSSSTTIEVDSSSHSNSDSLNRRTLPRSR